MILLCQVKRNKSNQRNGKQVLLLNMKSRKCKDKNKKFLAKLKNHGGLEASQEAEKHFYSTCKNTLMSFCGKE